MREGEKNVPNQLLTSPETMKYVLEVDATYLQKRMKHRKEKEQFVKQALPNKAKNEREQGERRRKLNFNK